VSALPEIAERNRQIVAMAIDNVPPREIAPRFGVEVGVVHNVLSAARKSGVTVPLFAGTGGRSPGFRRVEVDGATLQALVDAARKRGTTTVSLARKIIETVVREGLVDAVLDDGAGK